MYRSTEGYIELRFKDTTAKPRMWGTGQDKLPCFINNKLQGVKRRRKISQVKET
jgi:hypothetical protein